MENTMSVEQQDLTMRQLIKLWEHCVNGRCVEVKKKDENKECGGTDVVHVAIV